MPPFDETQTPAPNSDPQKIAQRFAALQQHSNQPERIGPYRILETLGEGGMGVVYLAEQEKPIHRRVALKIIKLGMDTKEVIARFETEREALAVMNHANVAKVFDAGVSDTGRPYFVMEYVAGIPITEYCDKHRLTTHERLRLFMDVCHAVQHAHQKGIIHRDIKPSNVLVAVEAGPSAALSSTALSGVTIKVIDFGVAKATQHRLTERTFFTEQGQLIGTPGYMSPEQAEMTALDIDTRTDIYSLGVLLYELLVGALPFDTESLRRAGLAEIQRIIREVDPPKPSTKLTSLGAASSTAAHNRHTEPKTLARQLRGDLDWIVMKCLEKDRVRRYDTANGLALEIQRHLNDEPVLASAPSATYRLKKFAQRNRTVVAAAGCVVIALLLGLCGTAWQAVRATRERDRAIVAEKEQNRERQLAENAQFEADARRKEIEQVADFQASMFTGLDVDAMGRRLVEALKAEARAAMEKRGVSLDQIDAQVVQLDELLVGANATNVAVKNLDENILARAEQTIEQEFADHPLVQARLFKTVADVLHGLGLDDRSARPQSRAIEIRRRVLGNDHPDTLTSINHMGLVLQALGKFSEAEPYYREALEGRRRVLGGDHLDTLTSMNDVGFLFRAQGKLADAETYYMQALEGCRRALGNDHPQTVTSVNNMGFLLQGQGKLAEAEPYFREALERHKRVLGDDHPHTLISISNMGGLFQAQGKLTEAEPYLREALERGRRVHGDDHPDTLASINNMGVLLQGQGKLAEAEPYIREALERRRRVLNDDHPNTLASINNMGALLQQQGKLAEAEPYLREALKVRRRVQGDDDPATLVSINAMGSLLRDLGQLSEAEKLGAEAVRRARKSLPPGHWHTAVFLFQHARTLAAMSRFTESEVEMLQAHGTFVAALGPEHERTIKCVEQLAALYDAWDAAEPGKGYAEKAEHYQNRLKAGRQKLGE